MPRTSIWQKPFDPEAQFITARDITVAGRTIKKGEPLESGILPTRTIRQLYDMRRVTPVDTPMRQRPVPKLPEPPKIVLRRVDRGEYALVIDGNVGDVTMSKKDAEAERDRLLAEAQ